VLDQKLRDRLFAIAAGNAPPLEAPAEQGTAADSDEVTSAGGETSESAETVNA